VTVLDVANNRVTQIKTPETDGYAAVQVTYGKRRASRVTKPQAGHLAKAGVEAGVMLREFPVAPEAAAKLKVGEVLGAATFNVGERVDVTGTTKGRGFNGVITRHHFSSNRASHGNSRVAQHAGLDQHGAGSGSRVPGQEACRDSTATSRAPCKRSPSCASMPSGAAARQGLGPGRRWRTHHRAAVVKTPRKKGA
jgi:large subunit ribosomal protein L3